MVDAWPCPITDKSSVTKYKLQDIKKLRGSGPSFRDQLEPFGIRDAGNSLG